MSVERMSEPRGHQSPVADFVIVYSTTERPFSHKQRKLISEKRHRGQACVSGARVWCLTTFCFFIIRKGRPLHGSPASHSQKDDLVFSTRFLGCCSWGKKRDGGEEAMTASAGRRRGIPGNGGLLLRGSPGSSGSWSSRLRAAPPEVSTPVPFMAHFHPDRELFPFYLTGASPPLERKLISFGPVL